MRKVIHWYLLNILFIYVLRRNKDVLMQMIHVSVNLRMTAGKVIERKSVGGRTMTANLLTKLNTSEILF